MRSTESEGGMLSLAWQLGLAWIAGLVFFLVIGWLLSQAALRASRRVPREAGGHAQGADAALRRIYRVVLWLCCAYYYASIPVVLALTVGLGGALIYGFIAIGTIPVKLVLIVGVGVVITFGAILKSLFVRVRDEDPGMRLDLDAHPKLRAVLEEVAGRVGTRPVDTVYMTPGTEIAVMERGGMLRQMRGAGERCLLLGAGVLKGMRVSMLKSVLAHEYGHFQNEDTAGGGFALAVRRSLIHMAIHLARGGAAAWYNPAWSFVRGFHRLFLVISQGASRLQEVLADRWAAHAYGAEAFESGMRHVIARSIRFDAHLDATLNEVLEHRRPLRNLYAYKPEAVVDRKAVDAALDEALNAAPSAYDSHPAPADRIAWVRALGAPAPEAKEGDDDYAWGLFSNRKKLERDMTAEIRERVWAAHNVLIRETADDDEEEAA